MTRAVSLAGAIICMAVLLASRASSATFVVNTEHDSHDINPGDGLCSDHLNPDSAGVSLRAAIEEASALTGPDTIILNDDTLVVRITLGALVIRDDSTRVVGTNSFPVVDGLGCPPMTSLFIIDADYCAIQGLTIKRSRRHGILIRSSHNLIGDSLSENRNIILGCGTYENSDYAIVITGEAGYENHVASNWIGLFGNGTEVYGNTGGILVEQGAARNVIGGRAGLESCFISGNQGWGVVVNTGAFENVLAGCTIGPNITHIAGPGNGAGGILIENSSGNFIGRPSADSINIISLNQGDGLTLLNNLTTNNTIAGNYIGTDSIGWVSIANLGHAISIKAGANHNVIGASGQPPANVLSGNYGDGIFISDPGTDENIIIGNYIGPSARGGGLIAGDTYNHNGITIADGASQNMIGGNSEWDRNVISLNDNFGVSIEGPGTRDNTIQGNYIGTSPLGISSMPNGSGVVIRYGAFGNQIGGPGPGERNLISGNRADIYPFGGGVLIYDPGSSHNRVQGNFIGTDITGRRALRNGSAGVIIGNQASHNLIGGGQPGEGNLISGNGSGLDVLTIGRGVHLSGSGTNYNQVAGNIIGLNSDEDGILANAGHGVGIFDGAQGNTIGGPDQSFANVIAGNEAHGVIIHGTSTKYNLLLGNRIMANDSLGIALRDGAQGGITTPMLSVATPGSVRGLLAPPGAQVDIYRAAPDPLGAGEGDQLIGRGSADLLGNFEIELTGVVPSDTITAIATDSLGNSSEFAANIEVSASVDVTEVQDNLPGDFELSQNYPNPFNPSTTISFTLPQPEFTTLVIFNALGQRVTTLIQGDLPAGHHSVIWQGNTDADTDVASGVYFYRLRAGQFQAVRNLIVLR